MIDAILLDFYGTVVHEDDVLIAEISETLSTSARMPVTPAEIGDYWWQAFSEGVEQSHGTGFRLQRDIERASLAATVEHFGATEDPDALSERLFDHWQRPSIFVDAVQFLQVVNRPVVIVSNIDRADIDAAIAHHGLHFDHVVTSEDVRSYKPRPELFEAGLSAVGLEASRVLHVGDSLTSDIAGAANLGIPVAWVNRSSKPLRGGVEPDHELSDLTKLLSILDH